MKRSNLLNRPILWLIVATMLAGVSWLWWQCCYDSSIPFLSESGSAKWIVYPKPPDASSHSAMPIWAVFRRSFTLAKVPAAARLSARAFKQGTVRINGRLVDTLQLREQGWKRSRTCEVEGFLEAGENEILVTVSNSLGPPALCLSLSGDNLTLESDPAWQVSLVGAAWQQAALASEPPVIRSGNQLFGRELMITSLGRIWPDLLLLLLLSATMVGGARRFLWPDGPNAAGARRLTLAPLAVLALISISWLALFSHNLPQIAAQFGFDQHGHLNYIDYVLRKKALPLADEGWQMYQPPLYYVLSALMLGPLGWSTAADSAVLMLRAVSALTGLAHTGLIFLCLRQLFPKQPGRQVVGLLLAGFLPANLCLSHHVTNESLAALFVTAALYFCLRFLHAETPSIRLAIAVGACLGLALLTKFSAVLILPVILGALAWNEVARLTPKPWSANGGLRSGAGRRELWWPVGRMGAMVIACLAVCGWHYLRVWWHFGNPLIGNWDPRLPFAWWQDPGYHMGAWYARFGEALICPLFSSLTGFLDGLYATLWGDGLCSGSALMDFRPQWNYDLMNAGYLLSILVTALVIAGAIVLLVRFIRQPAAEGFLLLGLVAAFAAGIGLMSLRIASYAQVKSFYALPAFLPLCVLAVAGWDFIARKSGAFRPLLQVGLLAWAMTAYSSFWIRSGSPFTYTVRGTDLADHGRHAEAATDFSRALRLETNSLPARFGLAEAWRQLGRGAEARQQAEQALREHPEEAEAQIEMGLMLSLEHRYPEAVQHLSQAVAKAPDHPTADQQLATCLAPLGLHQMVIQACEQGLRVDPFNPELHHLLAVASGSTGDLTNAIVHSRLALQLEPNRPETRGVLALALASTGQPDEAAAQYELAIRGKPDDPKLRCRYAATLTGLDQVERAVEQYRKALALKPDQVEVLNGLAWILATAPSDALRQGAEAVRLAEQACELTLQREPQLLQTLAAAYAEAGRFADAVKTAEKARDLATADRLKDVVAKSAELLELFRAGKPYRTTPRNHLTPSGGVSTLGS